MQPSEMGAAAAARAIPDRRLSAGELRRSCLARIAARDAAVEVWLFLDPELALRRVREADELQAADAPLGPLHGVRRRSRRVGRREAKAPRRTDQRRARTGPGPRSGPCDADVLRAAELEHAVQRLGGDDGLGVALRSGREPKPPSPGSSAYSATGCARIRTTAEPPRWRSPSTPSTAYWSSGARATSASPDPRRGGGDYARIPDPCNTP